MIGYIYLNTDLKNGKQYVGQHHYDKQELDPNYHGSGHLMIKIYKKRPETIKEEYIKTCYSQEELDEWEKYFIYLYNTIFPNGYNLTEGGNGGRPSEEAIKKMSKPVLQYTLDGDFICEYPSARECCRKNNYICSHIVDCCNNKKITAYGYFFIYKGDESLIKEKIEKYKSSIRIIIQYTLDGKFIQESTISDLIKKGFDYKSINKCIKGKLKTYKDYIWLLKGDEYLLQERIEKLKNRRTDSKRKTVLQYTLDGEFVREWESLCECGKNGLNISGVAACCRGYDRNLSYKDFIWLFKDDEHLLKEKIEKVKNSNKRKKIVLQYTIDGTFVREWTSTHECGRNGFSSGMVSSCCRGEKKTHKGYIWKYKQN